MKAVVRGALLPLALVLAWEGLARAGVLPPDTASRPTDVLRALAGGLADGTILIATGQSLAAGAAGLAIAVIAGVLLGTALGLAPRAERIVGPTLEALRPVPAVALIPLSLLLFGFGLRMEAAVIAFAAFWPVLVVTAAAVRGIEPRLLEVARLLELSPVARLRRIVLPAAFARILVGVRLAAGIALVVAVTVEIVLNPRGIGYSMMSAQQSLHPDRMYAELLWLGAVGWALNALIGRAAAGAPGAAAAAAGAMR